MMVKKEKKNYLNLFKIFKNHVFFSNYEHAEFIIL